MRSLEKALKELPGKILLDTTRRMAEPRAEGLRAFLSSVKAEAGEELY